MKTISVIIPAYNAEKTINRCISSVLNQSYPDFELLVIDDGSRDKTVSLVGEYCAKDSRIRLIGQENGGVSAARNLGISQAQGDGFLFLDSDDELEPGALLSLRSAMNAYGADLVYGGYTKVVGARETKVREFPEEWFGLVHSSRDFLPLLLSLDGNTPMTSVWRILFKAETVRNAVALFPLGVKMGEDYNFLLDLLNYGVTVLPVRDYVYRYYFNPSSVTANYINDYANDINTRSSKISDMVGDDQELQVLYNDCCANWCFRLAQNELLNNTSNNAVRRCANVLRSSRYSSAIKELGPSSNLDGLVIRILKLSQYFPLGAALVLFTLKRTKTLMSRNRL